MTDVIAENSDLLSSINEAGNEYSKKKNTTQRLDEKLKENNELLEKVCKMYDGLEMCFIFLHLWN